MIEQYDLKEDEVLRLFKGNDTGVEGENIKTGEYREFDESMRSSGFRPDFHLLDVRLPRWTTRSVPTRWRG